MPCKDAILPDPVVGKKGQTVEELITLLEEKHIRSVPIVDDNNVLLGLFGYDQILDNLLPVSARMEDGLQKLDFIIGAAPGVAKRLKKLYPKLVDEVLDTECCVVHPNTPTWEAVRLIVKYASPIPVVNEENGKLLGIVTEQSLITDFKKIIREMEEENTQQEVG